MQNHKGERLFWPENSLANPLWIPEKDTAGCELPVTIDDVRRRLFRLIDSTPNLTWQLLTKRSENIRRMWGTWPEGSTPDGQSGRGSGTRYMPSVWLGTTVENQEAADLRAAQNAARQSSTGCVTSATSAPALASRSSSSSLRSAASSRQTYPSSPKTYRSSNSPSPGTH